MKKIFLQIFSLFALIIFMITGCNESITGEEQVNEINSSESEILFDLIVGQKAVFTNQGITVELKDIPSDSRCAEDVVCVWAGNAELRLVINNEEATINTTTDPTIVEVNGYKLGISQLTPATNSRTEIDKDDYKAELILTSVN